MKETYNRPVCIIAIDQSGIGKGSGRSVFGIPLGDIVIDAVKAKILSSGGGHDMAAGFSLKDSYIDDFNNFSYNKN